MDNSLIVRGTELRYLLTWELTRQGPMTVAQLVAELESRGFAFGGRPSKAVSDALRWEMRYCRVVRTRRGTYASWDIPRGTVYRIRQRVLALRSKAALSLEGGHDQLCPPTRQRD